MKKKLLPLLALPLLSSMVVSVDIKLKDRVDAFINPPSKEDRKEDATRLDRAMRAVRDKYRRVMRCLSGKQACNASDFAILGSALLTTYAFVLGLRQGAREELAGVDTDEWSAAQKLARKAYIFSTDNDPVSKAAQMGSNLYEWIASQFNEEED